MMAMTTAMRPHSIDLFIPFLLVSTNLKVKKTTKNSSVPKKESTAASTNSEKDESQIASLDGVPTPTADAGHQDHPGICVHNITLITFVGVLLHHIFSPSKIVSQATPVPSTTTSENAKDDQPPTYPLQLRENTISARETVDVEAGIIDYNTRY